MEKFFIQKESLKSGVPRNQCTDSEKLILISRKFSKRSENALSCESGVPKMFGLINIGQLNSPILIEPMQLRISEHAGSRTSTSNGEKLGWTIRKAVRLRSAGYNGQVP